MNTLSLALDIMLVVVIVLITATSIKRGLIISIIEFVGVIVSAIVSSFLASAISIFNYNQFFKTSLINTIEHSIAEEGTVISHQAFNALPIFAQNELRLNGITEENILNNSNNYDTISASVEAQVAPIIIAFITKILMVIIFTFLMVFIITVSIKLSKKVELRELTTADKILSCVFGVFKAAFIVMVLIILIDAIVMMTSVESTISFNQSINNCLLFKFLYNINIPSFIINLVTGA